VLRGRETVITMLSVGQGWCVEIITANSSEISSIARMIAVLGKTQLLRLVRSMIMRSLRVSS